MSANSTANDSTSNRVQLRISVLTLILLAFTVGCGKRSSDIEYQTMPVSRGNIEQHVTASGTLSAVTSVDVGSQVSGKILALMVDFNSPVKQGQLIAEIDTSIYKANAQQAEGDLASANASVILKRQNLERKKILAPQRAASQLDLDQATAELAQAEATVKIKEAVLNSARANLSYCKITSPVDGIVISRKVDVGQTVTAAMTTPVLFTIAKDISRMNISAAVSEADIGQVKVDQPVEFTVDAFPDEVFHGAVVQVRKAPITTSNVVTYETIIGVDNADKKLFPGMTADVSILVAQHNRTLLIQNAAVRFTPPSNAKFEQPPPTKLERSQRLVYGKSSDGKKLRAYVIKPGLSDGAFTEILEGATEGTPLVTALTGTGSVSTGPKF